VVDLKTETAVISVKVDQNNKLLAELWDFYLQERVNDDIAWANRKPSIQASDERS
jgi:signal transduction protein with GAF and PtsI domain